MSERKLATSVTSETTEEYLRKLCQRMASIPTTEPVHLLRKNEGSIEERQKKTQGIPPSIRPVENSSSFSPPPPTKKELRKKQRETLRKPWHNQPD